MIQIKKLCLPFLSGLSAVGWNFQICAFASTDILKILCWETTFLLQDSFLLNQRAEFRELCWTAVPIQNVVCGILNITD